MLLIVIVTLFIAIVDVSDRTLNKNLLLLLYNDKIEDSGVTNTPKKVDNKSKNKTESKNSETDEPKTDDLIIEEELTLDEELFDLAIDTGNLDAKKIAAQELENIYNGK